MKPLDQITLQSLMPEKKAIIFDLFHTLTGPESSWGDIPGSAEILGVDKNIWNDKLFNDSYDRLCGRKKEPFTIIRELAHSIDPLIPFETIRTAVNNRIKRFENALVNIPQPNIEALTILKEQGKKIGLLSNADVVEAAAWHKSPIAHLFDSTIFSCFSGFAKPDREIYERSIAELGLPKEQIIFVGDGACNELQGAHAVGLTAVMITGVTKIVAPERITQNSHAADYIIESLAELIV